MRFTVTWSKTARDRMAQLWLDSKNQAEFTRAANRIDTLLSNDPTRFAQATGTHSFVLEIAPIVVVFLVDTEDCRVLVEEIRELGPLE